jgi:hypothetical protein
MRYEKSNIAISNDEGMRRKEDKWADQLQFRSIQRKDLPKVKELDVGNCSLFIIN